MSALPKVILVVGILALVAGVAFVTLDLLGRGDSSGVDPKDLGVIAVGVLLLAVGLVLERRTGSRDAPTTDSPRAP